jgi:uncharacterized protein DUF1236
MRKTTAAFFLFWSLTATYAQAPPQQPIATSPKLNLTLEQRYTIREIIKDMKVEPASGEVKAEVGEPIPQDLKLQPMPGDVARKVPQVKSHRFFVTAEQIVIVDPKDNRVAEVVKLAGD